MRLGATLPLKPIAVSAPPRSFVNARVSLFCPSSVNVSSSRLNKPPQMKFRCNCAGDSGENESKTILDAFFVGKAVGEAISERIESAVGEFLSTMGRFQAEQQKQVQDFQEEVLEKARQAKEQAAREAIEATGLTVPESTAADTVSAVNGVAINTTSA